MKAMAIDGSIQEFDVGEEKAKDLIAIDPESMNLQPYDLFQTGGTEDLISRIEEEARSVLPDVTTPKGRKAVASNADKVARSKTYIDGLGKDLVARLKRQSKLIDEERRRMRSRLIELKTEVRQPLTDFENREKNREVQARVLSEMEAAISSEADVPCSIAHKVVAAMADGMVPHVTIIYS